MEKRMKDRRFRRTEEKILTVFFDEAKKDTTIVKIAKKAKIGRSTIYTHHHAFRDILPDYQRYMLVEYSRTMKKFLMRKNVPLKKLFFEMLVFIMRNRKIFKLFLELGNLEVFKQMLKRLESRLTSALRLPKNSRKIFSIYVSEIVQVIANWGEVGFSEQKLESVLGDIVYLSETCRSRLMPISVEI